MFDNDLSSCNYFSLSSRLLSPPRQNQFSHLISCTEIRSTFQSKCGPTLFCVLADTLLSTSIHSNTNLPTTPSHSLWIRRWYWFSQLESSVRSKFTDRRHSLNGGCCCWHTSAALTPLPSRTLSHTHTHTDTQLYLNSLANKSSRQFSSLTNILFFFFFSFWFWFWFWFISFTCDLFTCAFYSKSVTLKFCRFCRFRFLWILLLFVVVYYLLLLSSNYCWFCFCCDFHRFYLIAIRICCCYSINYLLLLLYHYAFLSFFFFFFIVIPLSTTFPLSNKFVLFRRFHCLIIAVLFWSSVVFGFSR